MGNHVLELKPQLVAHLLPRTGPQNEADQLQADHQVHPKASADGPQNRVFTTCASESTSTAYTHAQAQANLFRSRKSTELGARKTMYSYWPVSSPDNPASSDQTFIYFLKILHSHCIIRSFTYLSYFSSHI